jgi:hypothetical protein
MDEKTRLAAALARQLQGLTFNEERLAELAAEVEVLNDAVRKAAERLTFDDEPAAFASLMEREAK